MVLGEVPGVVDGIDAMAIIESKALVGRITKIKSLISFQGKPEEEYGEYQGRYSLVEVLSAATLLVYFIKERKRHALSDALVDEMKSLFEKKEIDMADIVAHARQSLWYEPISKAATEKIKDMLGKLMYELGNTVK